MTLVVTRVLGLATIQDLGTPGRMHEAMAPAGALVPSLLIAANRRAGNTDGACAIELFGRATFRADTALVVATDSHARELAPGDSLDLESEPRRVAYLAVRGGLAAPPAFVSIGLGTVLRAGDRLQTATVPVPAAAPAAVPVPVPVPAAAPAIRLIAGPDLSAFESLTPLTAGPYRILPASDRVGTRLAGPALAWRTTYRAVSRPMACGALEIPPDGQPIVLGREHPITGGYPIAAVIAHDDIDRFHATRIGDAITFTIAR